MAARKKATQRDRMKDASLLGVLLGESLATVLSQQEDELAEGLAGDLDGCGERKTSGRLTLSRKEMKVALDRADSYVRMALRPIVRQALSQWQSDSFEE